jgi:hypothetical protein
LPLIAGVFKEKSPGEHRVAAVPRSIDLLKKSQVEVWIERAAGFEAGFTDEDYAVKGANLATAAEIRERAQILLHVRVPEEPPKKGTLAIGFCDPLTDTNLVLRYAQSGAMLFSMEFIPRTTRAQSMDALSSMASIAGYKAVLLAASALPKMFPPPARCRPPESSSSEQASPDCRPSPPPGASVQSSAVTTFAAPSRNKSKASAPNSSTSPSKKKLKAKAATPAH